MPYSKKIISLLDYAGENATLSLVSYNPTGATFVAWTNQGVTLRNALLADPTGYSLGADWKGELWVQCIDYPYALPIAQSAQREGKMRVEYRDNTTNALYWIEIPCPKMSMLMTNSDDFNLLNADMVAFKAAFEAYVVAPVTGNAVTITRAWFVGRGL